MSSTYKCFIAQIEKVIPIEKATNIQTAIVMGEQVIVSKDWGVGKVGLFFPADCQLSEDFCKYNDLYRDSQKNSNPEAKGFFDDNRRVRCQPFLGVKSEGFFCEVNALDKIPSVNSEQVWGLSVGESFDEIDGVKICEKYISPKTRQKMANGQGLPKKKKEVDAPLFHKHVDTEQFKYYSGKIPEGALISIAAKVHGTSARIAYLPVRRKAKGFWNKVKGVLGFNTYTENYEYLVGTRNVTMFEEQSNKEGFHGSEQFRFDVAEMVKPYLEKGMCIYGEIAGYANGKPIMGTHSTKPLKDKAFRKKYGDEIVYSYGCKDHEWRFHVYRITLTNEDGVEVDLSDQFIQQWCEDRGLNGPYNIVEPFIYDGDQEELENLVEELTERPYLRCEDYIDPTHISEGVVIRVDSGKLVPDFYKNKSFAFKICEGIATENDVDYEAAS